MMNYTKKRNAKVAFGSNQYTQIDSRRLRSNYSESNRYTKEGTSFNSRKEERELNKNKRQMRMLVRKDEAECFIKLYLESIFF